MGKNKKSKFRQVKLNQVFECEGNLYAIATPLTVSVDTNLSGGRNFFELDRI